MKEKKATSTATRHKDTHFQSQTKIINEAFSEYPKTMLQVSFETGIFRANICRYVATMERLGLIFLVYVGLCSVSKRRAKHYTTSEAVAEKYNSKEKGRAEDD